MKLMGIDPGLFGAVAWIGEKAHAEVMHTIDGRIDAGWLRNMVLIFKPDRVYIEKCQLARRADGKGAGEGSLTIGINYGIIVGVLIALKVPFEEVHPSTWKAKLKLRAEKEETPKARKERAIGLAQRLYPDVDLRANPRSKVAHDGKAEALLLCEYGRREGPK